jgi:hypothetical protein
MRGSGGDSGASTGMRMAQPWGSRARRAVRMVLYYDLDEALAAAGLAR